MSEEEKEAILKLKRVINKDTGFISDDIQDDEIETILGLINKQQKEIEELNLDLEEMTKSNNHKKEYWVHKSILNSYVSKDKIEEKIKELEGHIWRDGYMTKFDRYAIHYLKELLGE